MTTRVRINTSSRFVKENDLHFIALCNILIKLSLMMSSYLRITDECYTDRKLPFLSSAQINGQRVRFCGEINVFERLLYFSGYGLLPNSLNQ